MQRVRYIKIYLKINNEKLFLKGRGIPWVRIRVRVRPFWCVFGYLIDEREKERECGLILAGGLIFFFDFFF